MDLNVINGIVERSSADDMLDQMIEECGELIQACVKVKRAQRGTTPMTMERARALLVEELADVGVSRCILVRGFLEPEEVVEMVRVKDAKTARWLMRLERREAKRNGQRELAEDGAGHAGALGELHRQDQPPGD